MSVYDFHYQPKAILGGHPWHCLRLAVVFPLAFREGHRVDYERGFHELAKLWKHQSFELANLGLATAARRRHVLGNCRPSMYFLEKLPPQTVFCMLEGVCPWCYARAHYQTVAATFDLFQPEAHQLVVATHYKKFLVSDRHPLDIREKLKGMADHLRVIFGGDKRSIVAGQWSVVADPVTDQGKLYWRLGSRMLVIQRANRPMLSVPARWRKNVFLGPTSREMHKAVSRAFRYPEGLLLGPVSKVLEVMQAREDVRLSEKVGGFRGWKKSTAEDLTKDSMPLTMPEES